MKTLSKEELTYVGFIVKPSGFKGELILGLEEIDAEDFPENGFLFIGMEGLPVPFLIEEVHLRNGNLIVKLEDVSSEADAKQLSGTAVYLETPPFDEDGEPSFNDLAGYEVMDDVLGSIGTISGVEELPMQFIATCEYREKEILIPLNESIVYEIDPEKKQLFVRLPEGLIDIYLNGNNEDEDENEAYDG